MYCTHYIPSVLICICTVNKDYYSVPQNGVTDSVRTLLTNYNQHLKQILKMLLSPF